MKKSILVLVILLVLTGCNTAIYEPNPIREKEEEAFAKENEITEITTDLVFIDESSINLFAVDKDGNDYEISKAGHKDTKPGMIARDAILQYKQDELVDITFDETEVISDYVLLIETSSDDYLTMSGQALLRQYKHNSHREMSINDYEMIDISAVSAIEGRDNRILNVSMSYKVKPSQDAYYWGTTNEDGWTGVMNFDYTIYGATNKWLIVGDRLLESPLGEDKSWAYIAEDNQKILYETDTYTYYEEKVYKDNSTEEVPSFKTPIRRLKRSTGEVKRMYSGDNNITYNPVYQRDKYLFVETKVLKGSDIQASYFGVLDVNRSWMEEEIDQPAFYGTMIDNLIYVFTLENLYTLNVDDMKVTDVAKLPIKLSVNDDLVVNYVDQGIMEILFIKSGSDMIYHMDMETYGFEIQ